MSDVSPEIHAAPQQFKSHVWKNFGFHNLRGKNELDMSNAVCKLCHGKIKYCGNTTNTILSYQTKQRRKPNLLAANNKRWIHVSVSSPAVQKRLIASQNQSLILYAKTFVHIVWSKIQVFVT